MLISEHDDSLCGTVQTMWKVRELERLNYWVVSELFDGETRFSQGICISGRDRLREMLGLQRAHGD